MGKRIVLFNDLPGYGKVALAAMVPLFSRMGHFPYQVPTAVVSNTLDFGKFRIQDMTDYMRDTIKVWDELGFDPDWICTFGGAGGTDRRLYSQQEAEEE